MLFFPPMHNPSLVRKNIRQTQIEGQPTDHLTFKFVKVMKDEERWGNCHTSEESEETGQLNPELTSWIQLNPGKTHTKSH